jgi:glycogen operon protein
VEWNEAVFPYHFNDPENSKNDLDSAVYMPRSVVTNPYFDWANDRPPKTASSSSIIYEAHVKGLTARHPDIPPELRGTYTALAYPAVIDYLSRLGVTAIELMPCHQFVQDSHLADRGLRNYWGYNTINFFAPHNDYAASGQRGQQVQEFKEMVKRFHAAGLEVILDVVYNHTAEGNQMGPTLSFRGIDNSTYYRLVTDHPRYYMDFTGTGNTLNVRHPQVLKLIMDSLRYWVQEMHVDGFRFDLAAALARELHAVDRLSAFFDIINQDPVISQVKLIAEPWDVGEGGYQVGKFPPLWAEWNGRYRDVARRYWKGDDGQLAELGYRLTGSSDLYQRDGRHPTASINFITAHDGFTLKDLVSYNHKHNEANGEDNRDGSNDNHSYNYGAEGLTDDQEILDVRYRQMRNFIATLLLSQGVPMICGGDEIGRTQSGNNNAYAQDNEISWFHWDLDARKKQLLEFTSRLVCLRREHPNLHRRKFFQDRSINPGSAPEREVDGRREQDITWLRPDGGEMTPEEWNAGWVRCIGLQLSGRTLDDVNGVGEPIRDETFMMLFNPHTEPIKFYMPRRTGTAWEVLLDSAAPERDGNGNGKRPVVAPGESYELIPRSTALLRELTD